MTSKSGAASTLQLFKLADEDGDGTLSSAEASKFFGCSGLPDECLLQIMELTGCDGGFNIGQFGAALHLVSLAQANNGHLPFGGDDTTEEPNSPLNTPCQRNTLPHFVGLQEQYSYGTSTETAGSDEDACALSSVSSETAAIVAGDSADMKRGNDATAAVASASGAPCELHDNSTPAASLGCMASDVADPEHMPSAAREACSSEVAEAAAVADDDLTDVEVAEVVTEADDVAAVKEEPAVDNVATNEVMDVATGLAAGEVEEVAGEEEADMPEVGEVTAAGTPADLKLQKSTQEAAELCVYDEAIAAAAESSTHVSPGLRAERASTGCTSGKPATSAYHSEEEATPAAITAVLVDGTGAMEPGGADVSTARAVVSSGVEHAPSEHGGQEAAAVYIRAYALRRELVAAVAAVDDVVDLQPPEEPAEPAETAGTSFGASSEAQARQAGGSRQVAELPASTSADADLALALMLQEEEACNNPEAFREAQQRHSAQRGQQRIDADLAYALRLQEEEDFGARQVLQRTVQLTQQRQQVETQEQQVSQQASKKKKGKDKKLSKQLQQNAEPDLDGPAEHAEAGSSKHKCQDGKCRIS